MMHQFLNVNFLNLEGIGDQSLKQHIHVRSMPESVGRVECGDTLSTRARTIIDLTETPW